MYGKRRSRQASLHTYRFTLRIQVPIEDPLDFYVASGKGATELSTFPFFSSLAFPFPSTSRVKNRNEHVVKHEYRRIALISFHVYVPVPLYSTNISYPMLYSIGCLGTERTFIFQSVRVDTTHRSVGPYLLSICTLTTKVLLQSIENYSRVE